MQRPLRIFLRRLVTALGVLSLLLCLATVTLWVRSYWRRDILQYNVEWFRTGFIRFAASTHGVLWIGYVEYTHSDSSPSVRAQWYFDSQSADVVPVSGPLGFAWRSSEILFPHWSLAALFVLLPTYSTLSFIRHRKQRLPGYCSSCGYDLRVQLALSEQSESNGRATPPRCPECGTASL